jgi:pimeloyl-ACP methyl ester carboxylesterase
MTTSVFKSEKDKDAVRSYYAEVLQRLPLEQHYLDISFGKTFVLAAGAADNPPAVLLHGSCSNSVFMLSELLALSETYRVYAADIIGEAGNSDEHRPPLQTDAYARWLGEVFDGLQLNAAVLLGNSLGAWLSLKFAVTFPQRVSRLVLIAPSGLAGQNTVVLEKATAAKIGGESLMLEASVTGGASLPKEVEDFINLILRSYNPISEPLPVFTDAELQRLTMPVMMIAGRQDVMVDAVAAARRLQTLLPRAETRLIENVGHIVLNAAEFFLPFLNGSAKP